MHTINVSDASLLVLDWLIAQIEGVKTYGPEDFREQRMHTVKHGEYVYRWSSSWAQGGELKTKYGIISGPQKGGGYWAAIGQWPEDGVFDDIGGASGSTELEAIARCIIERHHGEQVQVPEELSLSHPLIKF